MVPVLDKHKIPLMPCSEKRARLLMERKQAQAYWQKGLFCIRLLKEPNDRQYQPITLGIDSGSKREGYTAMTSKGVILNLLTNTPEWVKSHVETRRMLRRNRRSRKTPYRVCRENRASLRSPRVPPSTKARWNAKLRMTKHLLRLLPITLINVEDIKAKAKKGKEKWNLSFSPLEVGKSWFYAELEQLGLILIKTQGFQTKEHRDHRGFQKTKAKLSDVWEAHNVDSHALAEIALATVASAPVAVSPFRSLYRIDFLEYHRRSLHAQNPAKKGFRRNYGSTVSLGMSRGSVLRYKEKLYFLGGTSKGKVSINDITTGVRVSRHINPCQIQILHATKWRTQFLSWLKPGVPLRKR